MSDINPNFDNTTDTKAIKFHFKKDDLGNKRETIELPLKVPSVEGIVAILNGGGKPLDMLLQAAADVIAAQARSLLNDDEAMTAENFPFDKCTWQFIADMPESEKKGRGIAKELWEDFAKDYISTMPAVTGKTVEQVSNAAKLYLNKFQQVKTNKPVIAKLRDNLGIYLNSSPNAETYIDCVKFLEAKAAVLIAADDSALLDNL